MTPDDDALLPDPVVLSICRMGRQNEEQKDRTRRGTRARARTCDRQKNPSEQWQEKKRKRKSRRKKKEEEEKEEEEEEEEDAGGWKGI